MGLASALNTALTGMTAAETTIDVVGNNLANSNTVGFKSSSASFASQFLQTQALGSSPTANNGGQNPRQIGLGTMVADITPNFKQGTIQISSSSTDLAIQGDGFYIVRGSAGEYLYTRNGVFKRNASNELTTITGNRVLGYGVNSNFEIDGASGLVPLTIPLGSKSVAQATRNVYLQGALSPTGDVSSQGQIIQTEQLTDGLYAQPTKGTAAAQQGDAPNLDGEVAKVADPSTDPHLSAGTYVYRLVTVDNNSAETESMYEQWSVTIDGSANENAIDITSLDDSTGSVRRLYRTAVGGALTTFKLVGEYDADFDDVVHDTTQNLTGGAMTNTTTIKGEYTYYVTFYDDAGHESVPSAPITGQVSTDGRMHLTNIPAATGNWVGMRLYRNLSTPEGKNTYYRVAQLEPTDTVYTDSITDDALDDPTTHKLLDFYGVNVKANQTSTLAVNAMRRVGDGYEALFSEGTFEFTGSKGGRTLATKSMEITENTTLRQVLQFMSDSMGIVSPPGADPENPIPPDASGSNPGFEVNMNGQIRFISNGGTENAVAIDLSGMKMITPVGTETVGLQFTTDQTALGTGAATDMVVYDSLGESISVRLTAVLESRTSTATTYRWFADSAQNISTTSDDQIACGTGLITFDGNGNYLSATNSQVQIYRDGESAANSPLTFNFDFSQISGLATSTSSLAVSRQDGSGTGTLSSFIIGNDGTITGVFSNGATRTLGQVVLARFSNAAGLEQQGENLFAEGVNSGEAVIGTPGTQGIGEIIPGAQELSNTDIGSNLVDLILASTMYRGNTRVVTTVQEMLDELMNLRR
jgi:flagellar hook protein FlgE